MIKQVLWLLSLLMTHFVYANDILCKDIKDQDVYHIQTTIMKSDPRTLKPATTNIPITFTFRVITKKVFTGTIYYLFNTNLTMQLPHNMTIPLVILINNCINSLEETMINYKQFVVFFTGVYYAIYPIDEKLEFIIQRRWNIPIERIEKTNILTLVPNNSSTFQMVLPKTMFLNLISDNTINFFYYNSLRTDYFIIKERFLKYLPEKNDNDLKTINKKSNGLFSYVLRFCNATKALQSHTNDIGDISIFDFCTSEKKVKLFLMLLYDKFNLVATSHEFADSLKIMNETIESFKRSDISLESTSLDTHNISDHQETTYSNDVACDKIKEGDVYDMSWHQGVIIEDEVPKFLTFKVIPHKVSKDTIYYLYNTNIPPSYVKLGIPIVIIVNKCINSLQDSLINSNNKNGVSFVVFSSLLQNTEDITQVITYKRRQVSFTRYKNTPKIILVSRSQVTRIDVSKILLSNLSSFNAFNFFYYNSIKIDNLNFQSIINKYFSPEYKLEDVTKMNTYSKGILVYAIKLCHDNFSDKYRRVQQVISYNSLFNFCISFDIARLFLHDLYNKFVENSKLTPTLSVKVTVPDDKNVTYYLEIMVETIRSFKTTHNLDRDVNDKSKEDKGVSSDTYHGLTTRHSSPYLSEPFYDGNFHNTTIDESQQSQFDMPSPAKKARTDESEISDPNFPIGDIDGLDSDLSHIFTESQQSQFDMPTPAKKARTDESEISNPNFPIGDIDGLDSDLSHISTVNSNPVIHSFEKTNSFRISTTHDLPLTVDFLIGKMLDKFKATFFYVTILTRPLVNIHYYMIKVPVDKSNEWYVILMHRTNHIMQDMSKNDNYVYRVYAVHNNWYLNLYGYFIYHAHENKAYIINVFNHQSTMISSNIITSNDELANTVIQSYLSNGHVF